MNKRLLALLIAALLTVSAPWTVAASAPDGEKNDANKPRPSLDWKAYPADIQALKVQLDSIRDQQKGLFAQMKEQHDQIREARKSLTDNQRKSLKKDTLKIIEQMKEMGIYGLAIPEPWAPPPSAPPLRGRHRRSLREAG